MASIRSVLSAHTGRIYVYLATTEIGRRFLQDAEAEGFTFADGVKPTEREPDFFFALNRNMTINYIGFIGRLAYHTADRINDQPLIKVDYRDIMDLTE